MTQFLEEQGENFKFNQWYFAILDIIEYKLYRAEVHQPQKKHKLRCNLDFVNKGLDFINLAKILKDPISIDNLPNNISKDNLPMITYSLGNIIRHTIFNYKSFIKDIDTNNIVDNIASLPCNCDNSLYKDQHHGHIVTGDLRIVENNKLRKILTYGPKYREPTKIDWAKCMSCIKSALKECILKLSNKYWLHENTFIPWKEAIIKLVEEKVTLLQQRIHPREVNPILKDPIVEQYLRHLHNSYIIIPIDKAANNVSFICKRFYVLTLLREVGLIGSINPTYKQVDSSKNEIISSHIDKLKTTYKLTVNSENKDLPSIYWLPKMHKTPIGHRFIIASKKCSIKPLSKNISNIFKIFYKLVESYHHKSKFFSGLNTFWVIQNNKPVLDALNKINKKSVAKSIVTYDFSTLYTKIPHKKLIYVMNKIVDFCFNGYTQHYLSVKNEKIEWTRSKPDGLYFTKTSLKQAIRYLIENSYFMLGNMLFLQTIGIPMGVDPAPFFANLFLFFYESEWIKNKFKTNPEIVRFFFYIFRFIDDLINLNGHNNFDKFYREIYPKELELKKENIDITEASFLDLLITIDNNKFKTKLFDKRNNFSFSIVRMPHRNSNIPGKMFYSTINAEILRICRATSTFDSFLETSLTLITRMKKQGANNRQIAFYTRKLIHKHREFDKYDIDKDHLIRSLIMN